MASAIPMLSYDQISQLNTIIYNIQDENKHKLDDILSEQTQPQNTSVLNLYHLTTQEWTKKQTTIDNMCRFTLTVMASLELMWQQRHQRDEEMEQIQQHVVELERQMMQLQQTNETYRVRLEQAEKKLEETTCEKQKVEELYRTQSCTAFTLKEPEADNASTSIKDNAEQLSQLQQSHKELQKKVSELEEQKQLAKMEIELAEIALKDAMHYKQSFESLLSKTSSRIDPITQKELHVLDVEQSVLSHEGSFRKEHRQLSKEIPCGQGLNYFASTPCLLFNDEEEDCRQINRSHSQHFDNPTPFKKKEERVEEPMNELVEPELQSRISLSHRLKSQQNQEVEQQQGQEYEKKQLSPESSVHQESSLSQGLHYYRPSPADDRKLNEMIARLKIKQSDSVIREEDPSDQLLRWKWDTEQYQDHSNTQAENSFSRFYNYLSSKVITNRIKKK